MDFKQIVENILTEQALTKQCKFQPGDIVIVRGYYRVAARPFINTIALIENDRKQGSQIVLYKVKVKDGTSHYIPSQYLDGPFKDIESAKKYIKPLTRGLQIDPADLIIRHKVLTDWQIQPKTEAKLKQVLTDAPFNYEWYEPPIIEPFNSSDIEFLLARNSKYPTLKLTRRNSKKTKKLSLHSGYQLTTTPQNVLKMLLCSDARYSWSYNYYENGAPSEFLKKIQMYKQSAEAISLLGIDIENRSPIILNNNMLKEVLEKYPLLNFFNQPIEHFSSYDTVNLDRVEKDTFKDVPIVNMIVNSKHDGSLIGCPETVEGDFAIRSNITSLEGCPHSIGGNLILMGVGNNDVDNIDFISGFPEYLGGSLVCPKLSNEKVYQLYALISRKKALQDTKHEIQDDEFLSQLM